MPRSELLSSSIVEDKSKPPDFFHSLEDLAAYFRSARVFPPPHAAPQLPYKTETRRPGRRLLVCHDFKGGYNENEFERGYTFAWWSLIDVFIYFSHHRVSMPPAAWIRAAHRHGTKILGTLIFEWDEGRKDIVKLTEGAVSSTIESFSLLDNSYADMLVQLCVERGFEGWLVNVEVPLGVSGLPGNRGGVRATEHASVLVAWLSYLRAETSRRVPGGETLWYDAVTKQGDLQWQSALTQQNAAFFNACDGIFTDYHWRPESLAFSAALVDLDHRRERSDIFFGVDVFGRGQFGGGGFDSWRALDAITSVAPEQPSYPQIGSSPTSAMSSNQFSVAIFAPGWTVESENLNHSLSTRSGYAKWWEDETYFWMGTSETANVTSERSRMMELRRQERGVEWMRLLARSLAPNAPPFQLLPGLSRLDYHSPLPSLPGSPRALSTYNTNLRPPICSDSTFYTNFSNGSGHSFFWEGSKVTESEKGWTDVDFAFSQPLLAYETSDVVLGWPEDEVWFGSRSIELSVTTSETSLDIPLCPIDVYLTPSRPLRISVVWKPLTTAHDATLRPLQSLFPTTEFSTKAAGSSSGWQITTGTIVLPPGTGDLHLSSFELTLSSPTALIRQYTFLVGSLSIAPVDRSLLPQPIVTNFTFKLQNLSLQWSTCHRFIPSLSSGLSLSSAQPPDRDTPWPSFLLYTVWFVPAGSGRGEDALFLGSTSATEMEIGVDLGAGEFVCRGVLEDGTGVLWTDAARCTSS